MAIAAKKSMIRLYSHPNSLYSHRVRLVLAEKAVAVEVIDAVRFGQQNVADLNPYGSLPHLVDRDLQLYESRIIMEYLDERFPHPPLLPVYPVQRAECRSMMFRIEHDWYPLVQLIEKDPESAKAEQARKTLLENFDGLVPILQQKPYFASDEFTMIDCYIAPLLWRLPLLKIECPDSAKVVKQYAERLFERPAFQKSLTEEEQEILLPLEIA